MSIPETRRHQEVDRPAEPSARAQARARAREHGRRRLEVAIGVLAAIIFVVAAPGLGLVAIIAALVLIVCGLSFLSEAAYRRHARRRRSQARGRRG